MSNAYWRYPEAGNAPAAISGNPHAPIAGNPHAPITGKRSRSDYDVSGVHDLPSYLTHADDGGRLQIIRDTESLDASYERYLRNAVSTYGGGQPIRTIDGGQPIRTIDGQVHSHSMEDSHVANIGGVDRRLNGKDRMQGFGSGRPDHSLPPDATNTLFVEGLPSNCSRREVAHIFRPFVGYKEVRLVSKESRQPGGDPLVLCFVDFVSPAHAATAMDALQGYNILQIFFASLNAKRQGQSFNGEWKLPEGYQFDEHDRNSVYLRFQFARHPGARSGGGHRGKR